MALSAILRLQTIVSREISSSSEIAVVIAGSIHADTIENVVLDKAEIESNIRTNKH